MGPRSYPVEDDAADEWLRKHDPDYNTEENDDDIPDVKPPPVRDPTNGIDKP